MYRIVLIVIAAGWTLAGCATLDRGTVDRVYMLSNPPGAQVSASDGETCVTPCDFRVGRRDELTLTISKAGYKPAVVRVMTRLNAVGVGDLGENVATAGAGAVVDVATGAALEHVPNPVTVTLQPLAAKPLRHVG